METKEQRTHTIEIPTLLKWTIWSLPFFTLALILLGAAVTTTDSGLSVPDWPLSFGVINPVMKGGVLYEHGHRLLASFVGFVTMVIAIWSSFTSTPKLLRHTAFFSLGLVIFQGILGGATVLMGLPAYISVLHASSAQLFFCSTLALMALTFSVFYEKSDVRKIARRVSLNWWLAFGFIFIQLILGATMRHLGAGLIFPDYPLSQGKIIPPLASLSAMVNFSHRSWAWMVVLAVLLVLYRTFRKKGLNDSFLPQIAMVGVACLTIQILLGAMTVWSGKGFWPTCLHVMNGAFLLGTIFWGALYCSGWGAGQQLATSSEEKYGVEPSSTSSDLAKSECKGASTV